jgi:acetyl-CoA carboxylase carboxyl transferase subunit alpha
VTDRLYVLENAYYSVISPEGCAAILWKDRAKASEAARVLKLTAYELAKMGIIDGVVPEPLGGAHSDPKGAAEKYREKFKAALDELGDMGKDELVEKRYQRFRNIGVFQDEKDQDE